MTSTSKKSKVLSLRECLLKNAVVNFGKIFIDSLADKSEKIKNDIWLPRKLFEDILQKSLDIFWLIPHNYLQLCLSKRDALRWENIDLRKDELDEKDVLNIGMSNLPLICLSFRTFLMTDAMFDVIEKFSSTIEVLEISNSFYRYPTSRVFRLGEMSDNKVKNSIKFEKLKKIVIDVSAVPDHLLNRIDWSSCSDSLIQLELLDSKEYGCTNLEEIIKFIESIKALKNLETLSIKLPQYCNSIWYSLGTTGISFVHHKNLRTLELFDKDSYDPRKMRLVEVLPKLENLTLHHVNLRVELSSLNGKMLNYVGVASDSFLPANIEAISKKFGSTGELPYFLNFLDSSCSFESYLQRVRYEYLDFPWDTANPLTSSQIKELEKIIFVKWMWFGDLMEDEWDFIRNGEKHWSRDFIMILAIHGEPRHDTTSQLAARIKRFMIDYVKQNPKSSISTLFCAKLLEIDPLTENQ